VGQFEINNKQITQSILIYFSPHLLGMKYSQIRIGLLTFMLGFVSVPFLDFLQTKWIESSIDLPKVESGTPIYISPKYDREIIKGGGSACGREDMTESLVVPKKKGLKSRYKH
jgi:hypothetical protein